MSFPITDLASFFFAQIQEGEAERDRVYEPVIGIVTDNKDPDKLGRVKVKLPFLSDNEDAGWAHVIAIGAGKDRGWFFLPEKDDEVLVAFEHGDIGHPVVLGQLWNGKDKPPLSNGGSNGQRGFVSRAGAKILFDDENKKIEIQDATPVGNITIDVENKKITIEAKQGDVCIQSPAGDLTIIAKELEIEGKMNVHLESLQGIDIGGDKAITIKGQAILQVHGSSIDIQPGGVSAPQAAQEQVAEVADPLTSTGDGEAGDGTASRDEASGSADGGGGGGGGAAAASGAEAAPGNPIPPQPPLPATSPTEPGEEIPTTTLEVVVVDDAGKPLGGVRFEVKDPSGKVHEGTTNPEGLIRLDGLPEGQCEVSLPDLDQKDWETK